MPSGLGNHRLKTTGREDHQTVVIPTNIYLGPEGQAYTCAGLDIAEQEDMLSSGHPVAWDIERGSKSRELLAIIHKRGYDTEHWAVRIDRASQRVTHISAGPLLRTIDFKPEVSMPSGFCTVSSDHT